MIKKAIFFIFFILAISVTTDSFATPECYRNARNPAHKLPFMPETGIAIITALNPDGESCHEIKLYDGAPFWAQKIYVPMRNLYETYAHALESGNVKAARRAYSWLKPTPRQFDKWLWLSNEAQGAPMPWGMDMAIKILRLLEPENAMEKDLLQHGNSAMPVLDMQAYWPILYRLMGGEVLPQSDPEAWTESAIHAPRASWLLLWHSPWAFIEEITGDNKKILLRMQ